MIRRFLAGLLYAIALSMLFLGSCVGPGIGYVWSPKWLLQEIDPEHIANTFFVAFTSNDSSESRQLHVKPFRQQEAMIAKYPDISFHMAEEKLHYGWNGDGDASISTTMEADGAQLVQVFVTGDTPWTSLSEYRVVDNTVYPLRHAQSSPWLLLGALVGPILVSLISKPVKRGINRLMRVGKAD
jgi:hypothetical protein